MPAAVVTIDDIRTVVLKHLRENGVFPSSNVTLAEIQRGSKTTHERLRKEVGMELASYSDLPAFPDLDGKVVGALHEVMRQIQRAVQADNKHAVTVALEELKVSQSRCERLEEENQALNAKVQELKTQIAQSAEKQEQLMELLTNATQREGVQQQTIVRLERIEANNSRLIEAQAGDIKDLQTQLAKEKDKHAAGLIAEKQKHDAACSDLETKHSQESARLYQRIDNLEQDIRSKVSDLENANKKLQDALRDAAKANQALESTSAQLESTNSRVAKLESTCEAHVQQKGLLAGELNALRAQLAKSDERTMSLEDDIKALRAENVRLKEQTPKSEQKRRRNKSADGGS